MNTILIALIYTLPLGALIRFKPISNVYIYPYDFFVAVVFLLFVYRLAKSKRLTEVKLFVMAVMFLVLGAFSSFLFLGSFISHEFMVSFLYLARFAAYLSLIFVVSQLDRGVGKIPFHLSVAGVIFAILGVIQHYFYPSLKDLKVFGWDIHLYRLVSTFLDPNFAGIFLVLAALIMLPFIINQQKTKKSSLMPLAAFALIVLSIFLTHSRSAFLALLAAGITYLVLSRKYKEIVGFVALSALGLAIFSNTSVEGLNPFRIVSTEARIETATNAIKIFEKHPIIGVGFNTYKFAQVEYGFRKSEGIVKSNADAGSDNSFLLVLATTGVVGFLLFVDLWINIIRRIWHVTHFSSTLAKVTIASIFALIVDSMFINSLFYPPIMAWIFILIGVTLSKKQSVL